MVKFVAFAASSNGTSRSSRPGKDRTNIFSNCSPRQYFRLLLRAISQMARVGRGGHLHPKCHYTLHREVAGGKMGGVECDC